VKIAAAPNASTTCGAGTVSALAGGTSFGLSAAASDPGVVHGFGQRHVGDAGRLPQHDSCRRDDEPRRRDQREPSDATLTVRAAPPVTLTKAFAPSSIALDGTRS